MKNTHRRLLYAASLLLLPSTASCTGNRRTLPTRVAAHGNASRVEVLIAAHANAKAKDDDGYTA
jgi:hypothetical protein